MMRRFILIAVAALLAVLPIIGCDDSPTESGGPNNPPVDTSGPVTHYEMYLLIRDAVGTVIAIYDAPADTLLDTLSLSGNYTDLAVTPDRALLFVSNAGEHNTVAIDLDSLSFFATGGRPGRYYFDGGRDLGVNISQTGLITFTTSNLSSRDSLSRSFGFGTIDTLNGIAYATGLFSPLSHWLFRYDYVQDSLMDSVRIVDGVDTVTYLGEMLAVPQADRLYFYGSIGSQSYVFIYNTAAERIVAKRPHAQPLGRFVVSADGRRVYVSDPDASSVFTSGWIWVYDVATDAVVDSLSTKPLTSAGEVTVSTNTLAITPDNRYLYSSGTTVSLLDIALVKNALPGGDPSIIPTDFFPSSPLEIAFGREIDTAVTSGP